MFRAFLSSFVLILTASLALAQNPAPQGAPMQGVPQDRSTINASVVITTGNTFQTILASIIGTINYKASLTIENNNTSDSCWIYIGSGTPTKGTSILLVAGGSYTRYWPFVPSDAIQATCTTSADTLYVDYQ